MFESLPRISATVRTAVLRKDHGSDGWDQVTDGGARASRSPKKLAKWITSLQPTSYRLSSAGVAAIVCLCLVWQGATEWIARRWFDPPQRVHVRNWECLAIQLYLFTDSTPDTLEYALWTSLGPEVHQSINLVLEGRATTPDRKLIQGALGSFATDLMSARDPRTQPPPRWTAAELQERLGG